MGLWTAHQIMRDTSTKSCLAELGATADAYTSLLELVATLANQVTDKFIQIDTDASRREGILCGYIAGLTLVEHAILSGYGAQSAALVRQELEAITALKELQIGKRVNGRTPNVTYLPSIPGRIYGQLSDAAHFAEPNALRQFTACPDLPCDAPESAIALLISPQHIPTVTSRLFGLHTLLLAHLVEQQADHYTKLHGLELQDEDVKQFDRAIELLRTANVIEGAK